MTFLEFADGVGLPWHACPKAYQARAAGQGLSQPGGGLRPSNSGGVISSVRRGSPAEKAGLLPGDELLSVNGHRLRDVIDYRFYSAEEELEFAIRRGGEVFTRGLQRAYGEELGLDFQEVVFDGLRRCENRCSFCFVDQLPPGMRSSLYIKDDDYRYSFLWGNFITLSNWSEEDWERVGEQRLSPLYVSVHATDLGLRRKIFGNPNLPDIREQLHRLGHLGIQVHAQVVLVPGLNDFHLKRTVSNLVGFFPTVQSIGVVPLGLTRYHRAGLRGVTPQEAKALVKQVSLWSGGFRGRYGRSLVYLADEFYLLAGLLPPPAEEYDDFPQLENGIGLVRRLLDEGINKPLAAKARKSLACGTLIAPLLEGMAKEFSALLSTQIEVIAIENRFFGPTITVSGLLTGQDVIEVLSGRHLGESLYLPRSMFDARGEITLDGMTAQDIEAALGVKVTMAETMGQVLI